MNNKLPYASYDWSNEVHNMDSRLFKAFSVPYHVEQYIDSDTNKMVFPKLSKEQLEKSNFTMTLPVYGEIDKDWDWRKYDGLTECINLFEMTMGFKPKYISFSRFNYFPHFQGKFRIDVSPKVDCSVQKSLSHNNKTYTMSGRWLLAQLKVVEMFYKEDDMKANTLFEGIELKKLKMDNVA